MFLDLLYESEEYINQGTNLVKCLGKLIIIIFLNLQLEAKSDSIGLGTILAFFTAAEMLPPLGFDCCLVLRFSETNVFPTASTCALELPCQRVTTISQRSSERG